MPEAMPPAGDTSDERQRRIEALRAIARDQQRIEPAATRPPVATQPRRDERPTQRKPRRTRWLVAGASIICVVVIGALVLRGLLMPPAHRTTPSTPPLAMLTLRPEANGIGCADDVAWSPQGTSIAVLGSASCGADTGNVSDTLNLYRAADGKLTSQIPLGGAIQAALASADNSTAVFTTFYQHVSWSPDGKTLAVSFSIFFPDNPDTNLVIRGVALSSPVGTPPHVLIQREQGFAYYMRWDLSASAASAVPDALFAHDMLIASPRPALSYQWTAQGKVAPAVPIPTNLFTSGPPPSTPGNPIGDATFTIWQPRVVTLAGSPIGVFSFQTDFLAWSPDGRYLADAVHLHGRLPSPGGTPSQDELSQIRLAGAPVLPFQDEAMVALSQQMHDTGQVVVAWRGNGIYVAAQTQLSIQDAGVHDDPARHTVAIYDGSTGDTIAFLTPERGFAPFTLTLSMLRWSPDSSHLLLYDPNLGSITIWGPSLLPK